MAYYYVTIVYIKRIAFWQYLSRDYLSVYIEKETNFNTRSTQFHTIQQLLHIAHERFLDVPNKNKRKLCAFLAIYGYFSICFRLINLF